MTGERLEAERRRAADEVTERRAQVEQVAAEAMTDGRDDEHDPDGATPAFELSLAVGLLTQAEQRLADLDAAIGRLHVGTYGLCTQCGARIPDERLEARAGTLTCVACASRSHRLGG